MDSGKNLTELARALRRNMTRHERHLWYDFLKPLAIMVHRQKIIGPYIVDFYIAEKNLVIELDGSQHFEAAGDAADRERDSALEALGLKVLRYSNRAISENFRCVCEDILFHLNLNH